MDARTEVRAEILKSLGAGNPEIEELLRYNRNVFDRGTLAGMEFPLPDEPFVRTWKQYESAVRAAGTIRVLDRYLVQLRFKVREGMSQDASYIAATREGADIAPAEGLQLRSPETAQVVLHPTPAGHIPLLIVTDRHDFELLIQALAKKIEPVPIPRSMGASILAGYRNWDRVRQLSLKGDPGVFADKSNYQDRFIILSNSYYSGVSPADVNVSEQEWKKLSLIIRREHECAHYFTRRVFSSMRNNLIDEIIADYCGIVGASGRFRPDWMLRFLGLEAFPHYRAGARLENYRGDPPLSEGAFRILQMLVKRVIDNLRALDITRDLEPSEIQLRALLGLSAFTLEELAAKDLAPVREALSRPMELALPG